MAPRGDFNYDEVGMFFYVFLLLLCNTRCDFSAPVQPTFILNHIPRDYLYLSSRSGDSGCLILCLSVVSVTPDLFLFFAPVESVCLSYTPTGFLELDINVNEV